MTPPPDDQQCITYEDMQTAACQQLSNQCTATGGTFGNINGENGCIPAGTAPDLPTCASGQAQFSTNPDGSSSANCVKPFTPNPTGVTTNTSPNDPTGTQQANIANNIAGLAGITQSGLEAIVNAIKAEGEGDQPGEGQGTCDPKAANYAQCIGQISEAPDADGSTVANDVQAEGEGIMDGIETSIKSAIENRGDVEEPTSIVDTVKNMLPQPGGCTDIGFSFKGATFAITCAGTELYRAWAAFVLAVATAIVCFKIAFGKEV